jgi:peptide/nickel transport system substrate-binding protein
VDEVRRRRSELENNLIDAYIQKRVSRREFIRRGTVIGMSLPTLGFLATACGGGDDDGGATTGSADAGATSAAGGTATEAQAAPKPGGTIRVGVEVPSTAIDPVLVQDSGGISVISQTGEYLTLSGPDLKLQPVLAESWEPNEDGSEWTFKIRQGVKFHNGETMTAKDVAATINRLADPANKSNALSAFAGVVSKGAAKATDDATVVVSLDAANGNFPYYLSSDNYNSIILPATYDGNWEKDFVGTGPFKLDKYAAKQSASFVRFEDYWGEKAVPDRAELTMIEGEQQLVTALQGNQVDMIISFSAGGAGAVLLDNPEYNIIDLPSVAHRLTHMRVDQEPFKDKRVRQAMALLVDRQAMIDGIFEGRAEKGNDNPFAPAYPSTDTSVPQRERDVEKAKQLLAEAGKEGGFSVKWNVLRVSEVPDMAQVMQANFKEAGINVELVIQDTATFYGDGQYGSSPWLDSTMGTVDYGHRGVPNVFLVAPLTSKGTWNSAHFKNPEYDKLVTEYVKALDVDAQKEVSGKIQTLLLDETPTIIPYFYSFLSAMRGNVTGGRVTAMSHIFVDRAGFTA